MDLLSQRGPTFIEPPTFIEVYGTSLAAFDSEHDENLTLTTPKEKKLKITNYPRFAITWDIQSNWH